jgi:hypothetical protein
MAGFEAIAGSYFTRINFKVSCFKIDRHNLAMITFFDLRSNLRFIDFITTPSKFFFAISGLSNCHGFDLASTVSFHFNLSDRLQNLTEMTNGKESG